MSQQSSSEFAGLMIFWGLFALYCLNLSWNDKRDLYKPMIIREERMAHNCPPPESVRHMVRYEDREQCQIYYNGLRYFLRGNH